MDNQRRVMNEGVLNLGGFLIPCYVLEDGTRVLSSFKMQQALKMVDDDDRKQSGSRAGNILAQKSLEPYLYKEKPPTHYEPLDFYRGNQKINGYAAHTFADICDAFLEARKNINLSPRQKIIADQCEILVRGFARVGLVALIDEATGYQYDRERFELQKILSAYVSEEILKWQKTFDLDFYREVFRLWGVPFTHKSISRKPQFVGGLTTKYVYEQLPYGKEVVASLKKKSGRKDGGGYKYRFHQSLTPEVGREALKKQINQVTALMEVSDTKEQFQRLFNKKFSDNFQTSLFDGLDDTPEEPLSDFNKDLKKALDYDPNA